MSTQSAYRSRHPDVLAAFQAKQDAMNAYSAAIFAVLAEHGLPGHQIAVNSGSFSPGSFLGVAVTDGESLPHWWRKALIAGRTLAVPDKRTKAGKEAASALAATERPGRLSLPGMPAQALVAEGGNSMSSRVCTPGVRLLDDGTAVYVTWSTNLEAATDMDHRNPVSADEALWEPLRLSDYWAAVEAADGKDKPVLARAGEASNA